MLELNNHIFSSHMVLPANKPLRIFGWGRGTVTVDFCHQHKKQTFTEGNEWCIDLNPMDYGGPYEMTVRLDERVEHLTDVYVGEVYLFYTYNHYNDFEEYLNYYGGWGEMFGNITGGGQMSSKYNCNPTPYVEVSLRDFRASGTAAIMITVLPIELYKRCRREF